MTIHQDNEERSPGQERLSRREALKDAAKLGLLLYCVPQVLSSEAVLAQSSPSSTGARTNSDSSGLAYLGLLPLAGLPFLGGAGAAAAAAGVAPAAVPTLFGIPLANASAPPLIGRADSSVVVPRDRATLPPRPFSRIRRNRIGGGGSSIGGGNQTRDSRVKRAIRGLG